MPSVPERPIHGRSIALKLTLFYAVFFGILALAGGVLLFQLVRGHVLGELDDDIARQKDEFVRVVAQGGELTTLVGEFDAYEASCGKTDCFARLTDKSGAVRLSTDMSIWPKMPLPGPLLRGRPGSAPQFSTVDLPDDRRKARLLSVFIPGHGYLQLGVSLAESESLFDHFRRYGVLILATMLSLGALIGWVLARKAMEGVEAVTRASRNVASGHFSERVDVSGHGREIDDLVRSFNLMVERVQTVMGEMRQVSDNIAHDLRSPLTRIRGLAENAAINCETHADGAVLAGDIVEECDRLMQTINTMLDISEAETGVGRLHRDPVNMIELVDQAGELFAGVAEDKGVTLTVEHQEVIHPVQGDRRKLQRVIANLIDNALKYTPRGGHVRVGLRNEPGRVRIEVSDTGIGIEPRDLPRIFERFYRCDQSRHQPGNGLGLSLAQAIARSHGGGLSVDSRPGKGSVFSLILPA
jgi:signal transduction histidine kinase